MQETIRIERAVSEDGRFIAEMVAVASDGIATIEWQQEADTASVSALDIGAQNYAGEDGDYSYRNCLVARNERGEPVGMILSFALTEENCSVDARPPPYGDDEIFAPYMYLEAVDSWYICALAVLPGYRGRDIGKLLLERAIDAGKSAGYSNSSLIAMASKTRLIDWYRSHGFEVTRSAPIVEHPLIDAHGDALLMETAPRA